MTVFMPVKPVAPTRFVLWPSVPMGASDRRRCRKKIAATPDFPAMSERNARLLARALLDFKQRDWDERSFEPLHGDAEFLAERQARFHFAVECCSPGLESRTRRMMLQVDQDDIVERMKSRLIAEDEEAHMEWLREAQGCGGPDWLDLVNPADEDHLHHPG
jgi:hypothetical protein